nr:hypothetical protein [uncultured Acetatifactor sp.]
MVVINEKETKFDIFLERLAKLPLMRAALFCAIAGIVFQVLGLKVLSMFLFNVVLLAIIAKALAFCLGWVTHLLSKFWVTALFLAIEIRIMCIPLESLAVTEGILGGAARVFLPIFTNISWIALVLAGIGFLIRIFVALFIK